ncbi:hypothetical protein CASFOL_021219 [Castilleja foliolosa]|uniref:Cytochrome P450 n=1 Tax=Castilleja foliolosa TaxID=1961234 RepID=A0ABD3CZQ3_9LAMI
MIGLTGLTCLPIGVFYSSIFSIRFAFFQNPIFSLMFLATLSLIICFLIGTWFLVLRSNRRPPANLPPGPRPFPIIGNILQLGPNPHQSLTKLSITHGPLMFLQLGSISTVVVSSPQLAKEILQKQDQVFSSRTIPAAAEAHNHSELSILFLPVGNQWRKLRKICREQLFSAHRLDASKGLRQEKLHKLIDYVQKCSDRGREMNIGEAAFITSLNLMSATLFSVDFADFDSDVSQELKEAIEGVGTILGVPNVADFFPVFKAIDPQGIKRKSKFYFGKLLGMFGDIINQRLETRGEKDGYQKKSDLLEVLLDLKSLGSEYEMSCDEINHFLVDLFLAGSDTTSITVEWAMMELLINPDKMAKAKNELKIVIGENEQVQESDISKLPYLQALVKETLRHHPAAPLLAPHKAIEDVEVNGYTIPQNTQILVNVWAIARDSSIWANPTSFEPERFLDSEIDFKGQDFTLLPFGSGRRMCPGLPLADRMLHLMVACLIHNFDWKLEAGVKLEDVDTSEKFGLSLHKAVPLKALPIKV